MDERDDSPETTEFEYRENDETGEVELVHVACGSANLEADSFDSYGGTTEGYTKCLDCGHTESWADLSGIR